VTRTTPSSPASGIRRSPECNSGYRIPDSRRGQGRTGQPVYGPAACCIPILGGSYRSHAGAQRVPGCPEPSRSSFNIGGHFGAGRCARQHRRKPVGVAANSSARLRKRRSTRTSCRPAVDRCMEFAGLIRGLVKIRMCTRPVTRRSPHLMDAARSPDIAANCGPQLLQSCWPPTGKSKCPF
jgi:hypothetical protein